MRALFTAVALALSAALPVSAQDAPPPLDVTLTPHWGEGEVDTLGVRLVISAPDVAEGEALLRAPVTLVSVPTARYEADDIAARDDLGPIPLTTEDEEPDSSGQYRRFIAGRATEGDVIAEYTTPPRDVTPRTPGGPLFDMRRQEGGIIGAGVYFYALPVGEEPYSISLDWDLSNMPEGSRGVWSRGEGAQTTVAPASFLAFSYYAAGLVNSEPEDGGDFAIYWFDEPPFDVMALASETAELYQAMSSFFDDEGAPYRVFIRRNIHPGGGGTALARSFIFGYVPSGEVTESGPQQLVAHEMAHNWPRLDGGPHALTAWYTEGTAEYYSLVLRLRAGLSDLGEFRDALNQRAGDYYANPHLTRTNEEAGALFWSDSLAQRVPYGRGLMYLIQLDARLKAASVGERGVDDLVLEVLDRQRAGESVDLDAWEAIIARELGDDGVAEFHAMTRGEVIVPPENAFAPCLAPVPAEHRAFDLGYNRLSLGEVRDLDPESNAWKAGLRDGDAIIEHTPIRELRGNPEAMMDLVVERDGAQFEVSYLPRGEIVQGWGWEMAADAAPDACGI